MRGEADRYGTTGMGVGVAVNDAMQANPEKYPLGFIGHDSKAESSTVLRIKDIINGSDKFLRNKLEAIVTEKLSKARELCSSYREGKFE